MFQHSRFSAFSSSWKEKINIHWFFDIISTVYGFSYCVYKFTINIDIWWLSEISLPKSSSFTMELAARLSAFSCFSISLFFAANSAFSWLWQAPISRQDVYRFINFRPKWSISKIVNIFCENRIFLPENWDLLRTGKFNIPS